MVLSSRARTPHKHLISLAKGLFGSGNSEDEKFVGFMNLTLSVIPLKSKANLHIIVSESPSDLATLMLKQTPMSTTFSKSQVPHLRSTKTNMP